MTAITPSAIALVFQSTAFDVVDQNGKPWLRAREIAAALGYADEDAISRIYARRADEFSDKMTCTVKLTGQVQDRETRIFSLRGAHLLAMFARTKIAKEFRRWVLDVLEQLPTAPYTVQPSDTLNEAQQIALRTLLETNVKRLPHGKQAGAMVQGWSKLKAHFGVPYRQIPAHEFTEALSIVARHVSAWELTDESPKPATAPQPIAAQPTLRNRRWLLTTEADGSEVVQAIGKDDFVATWTRLTHNIRHGECPQSPAELLDMAAACMHRLQQRSTPAIAI